jgi:hypothetical protein
MNNSLGGSLVIATGMNMCTFVAKTFYFPEDHLLYVFIPLHTFPYGNVKPKCIPILNRLELLGNDD